MIELLRERRSIRKFQEKPISPKIIEILKEAILRSPSSRNIQPWEFLFITQQNTLKMLSLSKKHGASFLANAPLGVLICADQTKSDVWIEDCSIAAIILQFVGQRCGLGSCWIQIRNRMYNNTVFSEDYIKESLNLSLNIKIEAIIALGYSAEIKKPIPLEELKKEKIVALGEEGILE